MPAILVEWMPYLSVALAAFATAGTMLAIGVAFLAAPSRTMLYWSCAYALLMISTFGGITSSISAIPLLLPLSFGVVAAVPALMWSGFRALRGARGLPWIGAVVALASAIALVSTYDTEWIDGARRTVIFVACTFAGLTVLEWWRVPPRRPLVLLPMVIASAALFAVGLANVIGSFTVHLASPNASAEEVRVTAIFVLLLYMTTSLVTVLGIALRRGRARLHQPAAAPWENFQRATFSELAEAQRMNESWSVIAVLLDDADDIRQTSGRGSLGVILRQFEAAITEVLPLDCQIGVPQPGTVIAVVPRSDAVVRDLLRDLLVKVSALDVGDRPLQLSASVGWAQTSTVGYELSALIYLARAAATLASDNGGDRWERTGGAAIETLIGSLQSR